MRLIRTISIDFTARREQMLASEFYRPRMATSLRHHSPPVLLRFPQPERLSVARSGPGLPFRGDIS